MPRLCSQARRPVTGSSLSGIHIAGITSSLRVTFSSWPGASYRGDEEGAMSPEEEAAI